MAEAGAIRIQDFGGARTFLSAEFKIALAVFAANADKNVGAPLNARAVTSHTLLSLKTMSDTEWEARYQSGDMPWEKGEASPGLVDFLAAHTALPRGTVCVPGCGTGHDVRAWAKAGLQVSGFDLAPSAIRLAREKTNAAALTANFAQADFLTDQPPQPFDWVFEHTLFCAIEPSQRPAYVQAVLRWLKTGGQFLAVYYMIPDKDGPPFGVTQEEIMERFSPHFDLVEQWVPRSYPNRTGLELMIWWRRKVQ